MAQTFHIPTEDLTSAYILKFLANNDWDDLAPAHQEAAKKVLAPDQPGWITLTANTKSFEIHLKNGVSNHSKWTFERGHPVWHDLHKEPGVLHTAPNAHLPLGKNTCWIQQYPPSDGHTVGRTVIEFYTEDVITAVFKTDVDNYGAAGEGTWILANNKLD